MRKEILQEDNLIKQSIANNSFGNVVWEMLIFLKYSTIALVAWLFIPTFIHELGHYLAGILIGLKSVSFEIFPIPYVSFDTSNCTPTGLAFIGISGILLPYIVLITILMILRKKKKRKEVILILLLNEVACILSLVINIGYSILYWTGSNIKEDDISIVFSNSNIPTPIIFATFLILLLIILTVFLKCKDYMVYKDME
jgi:hypothetical protein